MAASQATNNKNRTPDTVPAASSNVRRVVTDRSDLLSSSQRSSSVRNVRTSAMPNKANGKVGDQRETTDQLFNAEYAKKGIQPHSILAEKENRRSKKSFLKNLRRENSNSTIEQVLEEMQSDNQIAKYTQKVAKKFESLRDTDFDETSFEEFLQQLPSEAQQALKRRGIIGKIFLLLAYRKAFRRNIWIWSWAFPSWIAFQIPFALLSIAMMMLAVAIAEFVNAFTPTPSKDDGYIVSFGKTVIDAVFTTLAAVAKFINNEVIGLFGIDLTVLDPTNFFILTYVVVFAFGLLVLMAIYFIYALSFLHPLSGKGAGMKMGFLLLALVGYSIPVLNLLPWFLPWTLVVLRYPK